ncbi:hypothetical protein BU15DRAFT_73227 [Melanogaster broomeanus]|nr:hypothetical protein BU15DRAFT_73227 [Melanogaster broomeanus]
MVEKCTTVGIPHDGQNFKWKNLLDNLVDHQCYILDYPSGVHPFGPGFDYHNLSVLHMNALVVPYLKHVMGFCFSNGTVNPKPKTIKGKERKHVNILDTEFTIKP